MVDSVTKNKFLSFIQSKNVAVLSTVSSTLQPMSATIYFTVDEDLTFYFMTKSFTRKYQNIQGNNKVALVVGTENIPITAQIEGEAEMLKDEAAIALHMEQFKKNFSQNAFVAPLFQLYEDKNEISLYKIIPTWIRWLDLRESDGNNEFIQIFP